MAILSLAVNGTEAGSTSKTISHQLRVAVSDVRETSPLRSIAVPYDFKQTLETVNDKAKDSDPDDEIAERQQIREEARWLYITSQEESRDKLEKLLDRYRTQKERTQSGVWKLTQAYGFLRNVKMDWTAKPNPGQIDETKNRLEAWKAKYPQSPAPYLFRAAIDYYSATAILRDRLARSTYEGGIPALKAQIRQARELLEAYKEIASRDPYYYALLIMLMRGDGASADEVLQIAYESSERYPDYFDAYFEATVAIGSLSRDPIADVEALANTALEKTKGALGDEVYARIYWNAAQTIFGLDELPNLKWNWTRMKSSMETVAARYPVQWNIQNFAKFSCVMGDTDATRSFIARSRGTPLTDVWSQFEFFDACRQFAEAKPASSIPETRKAKAP